MEAHLEKLVEHAELNYSRMIVLTGNTSRIKEDFMLPVTFPSPNCSYEMALTRLETYYSFPNIDKTNCNIKVSFDNGQTWKDLAIETGCYEIKAINKTLQRLVVEAGGKGNGITLSPDINTLKCILNITEKNYQVDFNVNHSLCSVLGFKPQIYKLGRHTSSQIVNIMHVNSILVQCDVVGASTLNSGEAPILYTFFPNVSPGEKIVEVPINLIYVPVTRDIISSMTAWLTDQDGKDLNLRGETVSLTFHIRSC